ncbi:MAG: hypothetical protein M9953_05770 [Thermomicrobiales bacterium]|nr:hypothetical protein [Thermomicrobiales bacterium]MCO5224825.1 hypothetical protein [Thermomicrobiales bacterium]MCO5227636.1 hypothetical protein [Thermomicrobiales bacterium]
MVSTDPNASIVLIGPTGSGKSSVAKVLAELLGWSMVELDDLRETWYPEFGLNPEDERAARERGGLLELIATWKPYELLSAERVMREYPQRTVIAFGGGQSVYAKEEDVQRAREALSVASRVILLLPSDDPDTCLAILRDRMRHDPFIEQQDDPETLIRDFTPILKTQIQSESNARLATELIVTGQSTPEEIARHIVATTDEVRE